MARLLNDEQHRFFLANHKGRGGREMAELMNETFGLDMTAKQVKSYRGNHKLNSGLTGRFEEGNIPHNKGKKGQFSPGSEKGWFKKGIRPLNYRKVGEERFSDGYWMVKVSDKGGQWERWRLKHVVLWEEKYGPVPKGKVIVFKNQNTSDIRIENLCMLDRGDHARMSCAGRYSTIAEVTENNILVSKIEGKIKDLEDRK